MRKIWLDADPGIDDALALAMLFEAPETVEIIGLSSIFGNVDIDQTTRNSKIIFEAAGKTHLSIARGAYAPLVVPLDTSPYVHGTNGLGDMPLPTTTMEESPLGAPQAMIKAIKEHPHDITLLLIGPLTNAALALLMEPSIVHLVNEVVIMGGAVRCPGNITPVAEANFFHDPHAAQMVINAQWPVTLAPLDLCPFGLIPQTLLDKIFSASKALTPFLAGSIPFYQRFLAHFNTDDRLDFPDAFAAAYLLQPDIFYWDEISIFIETEGACMGQSVEVPFGKWYQNLEDPREFVADKTISLTNVIVKADERSFLRLVERLLT